MVSFIKIMHMNQKIFQNILNSSPKVGDRALDLGCGAGVHAIKLAENGYIVDAVDANAAQVNSLKDKLGNLSIRPVSEDITRFNIEGDTYSLVVARNVFPFIKDKEIVAQTIQNIAKGLKSGGSLFFTLFGTRDAWAAKVTMSFFDYEEILPTLKNAGLEVVEKDEYEGEGPTMSGEIKHWHIHTYLCKKR